MRIVDQILGPRSALWVLAAWAGVACGEPADGAPGGGGAPGHSIAEGGRGGAPPISGGAVGKAGTTSLGGMPQGGGNSPGGASSGGVSGATQGGGPSGGGLPSGGSAGLGLGGVSASGGAPLAGASGSAGADGPHADTQLEGILGFATVPGHGRSGTTGAGRAPVVRVSNFADFAAAVKDSVPRIVEVSGTLQSGGVAMVDVGSNKTILGVGTNATIDGFGLDINGWTGVQVAQFGDLCGPEQIDAFPRVENVIVRNLTFKNAADDSINIQCYSHHVWVDHNTFHAGFDGSVDVKRGSDLVTVSWNHFVSTDKTMLLGHSANNGEQDRGFLRATYHHNWFDNTATRAPRVRFGYAHVFNNYLNSTDYFLGLGVDAQIYAEGNYVERAKTITQTFTESTGYHLTWTSSNWFDRATITRANGSGGSQADWLDADDSLPAPRDYPYSVDAAASLSSSIKAGAGAGKI